MPGLQIVQERRQAGFVVSVLCESDAGDGPGRLDFAQRVQRVRNHAHVEPRQQRCEARRNLRGQAGKTADQYEAEFVHGHSFSGRFPKPLAARVGIVRETTVQCLLLIIPRSGMATLTRRQPFLERR